MRVGPINDLGFKIINLLNILGKIFESKHIFANISSNNAKENYGKVCSNDIIKNKIFSQCILVYDYIRTCCRYYQSGTEVPHSENKHNNFYSIA